MIHIRTDNEPGNSMRTFACGIGPDLPQDDKYFFAWEAFYYRIDCPACKPFALQFGKPISQLSGRPGRKGFDSFSAIAASWGYE